MNQISAIHRIGLRDIIKIIHSSSKQAGWWDNTDPVNKETKATKLALIHSEVSECLEGVRKDTMDNHLPTRKTEEVELADIAIRVFDYAGFYGFDLATAIDEKLRYNAQRLDHKKESRAKKGGKAF